MREVTIDPQVIAGRRQKLRNDAPCEGCGATLAACMAERGKDPTAPNWIGCCARGLDLRPCLHRTRPAGMAALLDEIASGHVRSVTEIEAEEAEREARRERERGPIASDIATRLDQGKWWRTKQGEWVQIADMSCAHRRNTAVMLLRHAPAYELAVSLSDLGLTEHMSDRVEDAVMEAVHRRMENPHKWIRGTALYRALLDGLSEED